MMSFAITISVTDLPKLQPKHYSARREPSVLWFCFFDLRSWTSIWESNELYKLSQSQNKAILTVSGNSSAGGDSQVFSIK